MSQPGGIDDVDNLQAEAEAVRDRVVDFCQRLIQTPSLSGAEDKVARLVATEMQALGYDDVQVDPAGNVIGLLRGGSAPVLMFNCHMDHVDPGDPARWPVDPYSGEIVDGAIWGRGSVDVKGSLAAQVYGVSLLRSAGLEPGGDVLVTAVIMEEVGGIGTQALLEGTRADYAVVGEPTGLALTRGHRGRVELVVRVRGQAAHASAPQRGRNPHYDLARVLLALEKLEMQTSLEFGPSTAVPTLYHTDQLSANVIPGEAWVHVDWRNVPEESLEQIVQQLEDVVTQALAPDNEGFVVIPKQTFDTYTGHRLRAPAIFPPFSLPADHPLLTTAKATLDRALHRDTPVGVWHFATDGGHLMAAGIPTIGFAPGEESLAHTNREHVQIEDLIAAVLGNAALARHLTTDLTRTQDLP
jgi:succinyl-diaminopimelate desuccinylase